MPIGVYCLFTQAALWGLVLAAVGFAGFPAAVARHRACQARLLHLGLLQEIAAESSRRIAEGPVVIRDGNEPADIGLWSELFAGLDADGRGQPLSRQEIVDLDVFGESLSLFGLLNRTSSQVGAARLAWTLRNPLVGAEAIQTRQQAVRWLAEHDAERLQLAAAAAGFRAFGASFLSLYQTINKATPLPRQRWAAAVQAWGLAGPAAVLWGLADAAGVVSAPLPWLPLAVVSVLNVFLRRTLRTEVLARIRPWLDLGNVVERFCFFAETAVNCVPGEGLLGEQRRRLEASAKRVCLPALACRIPLLYLGLSGLMHTVIDLLVFWDLQVLRLLERCYLGQRSELLGAFAALAECETLVSLACFAAEEPDATWPSLVSPSLLLHIDDGRHPMLPFGQAVANTLLLNRETNTWVITGSNMSGKSTFLRMVGVNLLHARVGSAVTARSMRASPMELLTDLRIRDDLSRQESYFLAEVRQVRRMVEAASSGQAFLALIDEPFRGTNSPERVAAARAVISTLIDGGGLHLVATHDAVLTVLGEQPKAANKHFQESLDHGHMVFDFRLQSGPATSRNALNVLEAEGYPPSLVARARQLLGCIDGSRGE